jgi:hypothetical protein
LQKTLQELLKTVVALGVIHKDAKYRVRITFFGKARYQRLRGFFILQPASTGAKKWCLNYANVRILLSQLTKGSPDLF